MPFRVPVFFLLLSRCLPALLAALLSAALLGSCTGGTTSGTETGGKISLQGRVVDNNGPVQGIVARLSLTGLADTTDALGRYLITGEKSTDPAKTGLLDTLLILQDSQRVATLGITKWVDSLPDIKLVQRGFSGILAVGGVAIGKVEAVLFGTGVPQEHPVVTEFFYNKPAEEFSGFVYFPASGKEATYSIYVDIFDTDGFLIGRSDTLSFNGLAGNITIPKFSAENVKLRALLGEDTLVPPGAAVVIKGSSSTPPGSTVVEAFWKVGLEGAFSPDTSGSVSFIGPTVHDSSVFVVRKVKNDKGAVAFDTLEVRTGSLQDPKVSVRLIPLSGIVSRKDKITEIFHSTVFPGAEYTLLAATENSAGYGLGEIAWRIGEEAELIRSPSINTATFVAPHANDSAFSLTVRFTDTKGSVAYDSIQIETWPLRDPDLIAHAGKDTLVAPGSMVVLKATADVPAISMVSEYAWKIGTEGFAADSGTLFSFTAPAAYDSSVSVVLSVKDNLGSISYDTVVIRTGPLSDPRLFAHAGADTIVSPASELLLRGSATLPSKNKVVEYAWRIGPATGYIPSPNGETKFTAPSQPDSTFAAVLRVKNEVGSVAYDTLTIRTTTLFDTLEQNPWRVAAEDPGLPQSYFFNAIEFRGELWLFNQYPSEYSESGSIWKSADGKTWSQVNAAPAYGNSGNFPVVGFKDRLWILRSNARDVWSSANGVDWVQEADASTFLPGGKSTSPDNGSKIQTTVFQNKLWVIGLGGCWSSDDGKHWALITDQSGFQFPMALQVLDGKMWLIDPRDVTIGSSISSLSRLFVSGNGEKWDSLSTGSPSSGLVYGYNGSVLLDGRMVFVSANSGTITYLTKDYLRHTVASDFSQYGSRQYAAVASFKGKLWVIGGRTGASHSQDWPKSVLYRGGE